MYSGERSVPLGALVFYIFAWIMRTDVKVWAILTDKLSSILKLMLMEVSWTHCDRSDASSLCSRLQSSLTDLSFVRVESPFPDKRYKSTPCNFIIILWKHQYYIKGCLYKGLKDLGTLRAVRTKTTAMFIMMSNFPIPDRTRDVLDQHEYPCRGSKVEMLDSLKASLAQDA